MASVLGRCSLLNMRRWHIAPLPQVSFNELMRLLSHQKDVHSNRECKFTGGYCNLRLYWRWKRDKI